jgi:RsiW-degrading membrane proteinase PrsW (M82 family)
MLVRAVVTVIAAFIPPLIYVVWIRNTERYEREPWGAILVCFAWGAGIATFASLILEVALAIPVAVSIEDDSARVFVAAVIVAPIVEEFTKPLVLGSRPVKSQLNELEDGLIYGAAAGLGFSATENLFYGAAFMSEGLAVFMVLIAVRTVGACLLHAAATAVSGYGYGLAFMNNRPWATVLPYVLLAVGAHALYNLVASFEGAGAVTSVGLAVLVAVGGIMYVRDRIRTFDRQSDPVTRGF